MRAVNTRSPLCFIYNTQAACTDSGPVLLKTRGDPENDHLPSFLPQPGSGTPPLSCCAQKGKSKIKNKTSVE